MSDKAKEFWIEPDSEIIYSEEDIKKNNIDASKFIHVVEYSAFEKLLETLRFYANPLSYSIDDYRGISGEMYRRCVLHSDCEERNEFSSWAGRRARQTIKEIGL